MPLASYLTTFTQKSHLASFKQECVPTGAKPVQTGCDSDRARIAVVAQPCADFFDALLDVMSLCKTITRQVHLVDV